MTSSDKDNESKTTDIAKASQGNDRSYSSPIDAGEYDPHDLEQEGHHDIFNPENHSPLPPAKDDDSPATDSDSPPASLSETLIDQSPPDSDQDPNDFDEGLTDLAPDGINQNSQDLHGSPDFDITPFTDINSDDEQVSPAQITAGQDSAQSLELPEAEDPQDIDPQDIDPLGADKGFLRPQAAAQAMSEPSKKSEFIHKLLGYFWVDSELLPQKISFLQPLLIGVLMFAATFGLFYMEEARDSRERQEFLLFHANADADRLTLLANEHLKNATNAMDILALALNLAPSTDQFLDEAKTIIQSAEIERFDNLLWIPEWLLISDYSTNVGKQNIRFFRQEQDDHLMLTSILDSELYTLLMKAKTRLGNTLVSPPLIDNAANVRAMVINFAGRNQTRGYLIGVLDLNRFQGEFLNKYLNQGVLMNIEPSTNQDSWRQMAANSQADIALNAALDSGRNVLHFVKPMELASASWSYSWTMLDEYQNQITDNNSKLLIYGFIVAIIVSIAVAFLLFWFRLFRLQNQTLLKLVRDTNEQAQHIQRSRSLFLTTMNIDLRRSLDVVLGYVEMITESFKKSEPREQVIKNINRLHEAVNNLRRNLSELASIAQVDKRKKLEANNIAVLSRMLEILKDDVKDIVTRARVRLVSEMSVNLPDVTCNPRQLRKVLYYLTLNAIKYTPESGTITIRIRLDAHGLTSSLESLRDSALLLEIHDNGLGIPPNRHGSANHNSDNGESGQIDSYHSGVDIGISIANDLCELMGINFTIQSQMGRGTLAVLRFPPELINQPREHGL